MDISMDIHEKSVDMDMDMDMDVIFHIHGNPGNHSHITKHYISILFINNNRSGAGRRQTCKENWQTKEHDDPEKRAKGL